MVNSVKIVLIILFAGSFIFPACVETIDLQLPDSHTKLVLFGNLDPSWQVWIDVSTSMQINSPANINKPSNAHLLLKGPGLPISGSLLIYDPVEDKYRHDNPDFRPRQEENYIIEATVPGEEIPEVFAETHIPRAIPIGNFDLDELIYTHGILRISGLINLGMNRPESQHFLLRAQIAYMSEKIDEASDTVIMEKRTSLSFIAGLRDHQDEETHSLQYPIGLLWHSQNPEMLNISLSSQMSSENPVKFLYIQLELSSITQELFDFYLVSEKQQHALMEPFLSPIANRSNIKNGLGFLGGMNTTSFRVPIH